MRWGRLRRHGYGGGNGEAHRIRFDSRQAQVVGDAHNGAAADVKGGWSSSEAVKALLQLQLAQLLFDSHGVNRAEAHALRGVPERKAAAEGDDAAGGRVVAGGGRGHLKIHGDAGAVPGRREAIVEKDARVEGGGTRRRHSR